MYEKLKKILSTRGHVLVRDVDLKKDEYIYCVFSRSRQNKFTIICTDWHNHALKAISEEDEYFMKVTKKYLEDFDFTNWQIIDVFDTPQERFKVGDEVVKNGSHNKRWKVKEYDKGWYKLTRNGKKNIAEHHELSYPFQEEKKLITEINLTNTRSIDFEKDFILINGKKYKLIEIK